MRLKHGVAVVTPAKGAPRYAAVVGKKISKKAPVRNRLRRQLYAAMREHMWGKGHRGANVVWLYQGDFKIRSAKEFEGDCAVIVDYIQKHHS